MKYCFYFNPRFLCIYLPLAKRQHTHYKNRSSWFWETVTHLVDLKMKTKMKETNEAKILKIYTYTGQIEIFKTWKFFNCHSWWKIQRNLYCFSPIKNMSPSNHFKSIYSDRSFPSVSTLQWSRLINGLLT